jgi:1-pyrroline-5-carboxylate dehydrogenase
MTKRTVYETLTVLPNGPLSIVFSTSEANIDTVRRALRFTAGNFHINDKPTGSVVALQPFGGACVSGTNRQKADSPFNLLRWISPLTIKRTEQPAI